MSAARERFLAAIIAELDAIDCADPERAHSEADEILLASADMRVAEAYRRVAARCKWWAFA